MCFLPNGAWRWGRPLILIAGPKEDGSTAQTNDDWDRGALPNRNDREYARLLEVAQRAWQQADGDWGTDQHLSALQGVAVALMALNDYVDIHDDWTECDEECRTSGHRPGEARSWGSKHPARWYQQQRRVRGGLIGY
jgi:hypothetical protein